jgi:hypothetical protein
MNRSMFEKIKTGSAIALALACSASGCSDDVVEDPTFRQWCGEALCAWTLEEGSIRRAPTWHHEDYGVEFTGTPTRISQYSDKNPQCLLFTSVADVDPRAQMTVEIDFNSDGKIDYSWPVPSSNWHQVQTLVTAPRVPQGSLFGAWRGFTIAIHKTGPGRAVLAQMRVQGVKDCDRSAAVRVDGIELGRGCGEDADCASGICCRIFDGSSIETDLGVCSACCPQSMRCTGPGCNTTCPAPSVCRMSKPAGAFEAPFCGTRFLKAGEECSRSEDCETGSCIPRYVIPDGGWNPEDRGPFEPVASGCTGDGGAPELGCAPEVKPRSYCR